MSAACNILKQIYTIIKTTRVGDTRLSVEGVAGWPVILTGWPVTVGVVGVDVVDGCYSVSQPGTDAERYRCTCLHWGWLGVVTGISVASTGGVLVQ